MSQSLLEVWLRDRDKTPVPRFSQEGLQVAVHSGNREFFQWYFKQHIDSIMPGDLQFLFTEGRILEIEFIERTQCNVSSLQLEQLCYSTELGRIDPDHYCTWLISMGRVLLLQPYVIVSIAKNFFFRPRDIEALRDLLQCLILMEKTRRREVVCLLLGLQIIELTTTMGEVGLLEPIFLVINPGVVGLEIYATPDDQDIRTAFELIKGLLPYESEYKKIIDYVSKVDNIEEYGRVFLSYLLNPGNQSIRCLDSSPSDDMIIYFLHSGIVRYNVESLDEIDQAIRMVVYHGSKRVVEELRILFDTYDPDNDEDGIPTFREIYIKSLNRCLHSLTHAVSQTVLSREVLAILARYELVLRMLESHIDLKQEHYLEILNYSESTEIGKLLLHQVNESVLSADNTEITNRLMSLGDSILAKVIDHGSSVSVTHRILNANLGLIGDDTLYSMLRSDEIFTIMNPIGMKSVGPLLREYCIKNRQTFIREIIRKFRLHKYTHLKDLLSIRVPHASIQGETLILGNYRLTTSGFSYTVDINTILCATCKESVGDRPYVRDGDSHGIFYCDECVDESQAAQCVVCMSSEVELKMRILSCNHVVCTECLSKITNCPYCRTDVSIGRTQSITEREVIDHFISYSS